MTIIDFGVGAEIAATISHDCFDYLRGPVRHLGAPYAPAPFAPQLEAAHLPDPGAITRVIHQTVEK